MALPLSKFNRSYDISSPESNTRTSYDSTNSHSSQDSHISSMSTASEDFADHHHTPSSSSTHQRNISTASNMTSDSTRSNAPQPPNHHKPLPPSPQAFSATRSERRSIVFADGNGCAKPVPESPKHPHLAKLKRQKVKRANSRDGGYVWYAKNCKRIHDECEADGVCDLDRSNERVRD